MPAVGAPNATSARDHPVGVLGRGSHPDIQILRGTHVAVGGERVRADDQELSARVVQCGKQISEVG